MKDYDISIFDTRSNTIEKVATNPISLYSNMNQAVMSRNGQVVALVFDLTNSRFKAVSFTKGEDKVRLVKDFGKLWVKEHICNCQKLNQIFK